MRRSKVRRSLKAVLVAIIGIALCILALVWIWWLTPHPNWVDWKLMQIVYPLKAKLRGFKTLWIKLGMFVNFQILNDKAFGLKERIKFTRRYSAINWDVQVEVFDLKSGRTIWERTLPNPVRHKGLSTSWQGIVRDGGKELWVVALNAGRIYALNPKTGDLLWQHDFGFPIWTIYQGGKVVFIRHGDGIFCFEPNGRQILWSVQEKNGMIDVQAGDNWLQVTINPYGDKPAYTRWFSLDDGCELESPPEQKKIEPFVKLPNFVKAVMKQFPSAKIGGQWKDLMFIVAEDKTAKLIAVNSKSGKEEWSVGTDISDVLCGGPNFNLHFVRGLLFFLVSSNHSHHDGQGTQLFVIDPEKGSIIAKAEWITSEGREWFKILEIRDEQILIWFGDRITGGPIACLKLARIHHRLRFSP